MIQRFVGEKHRVFDEDRTGPHDEGGEEVDVDVVSGAVELPVKASRSTMLRQREL